MPVDGHESYPLPEVPALAEVARALRDTGQQGFVVDDRWRLVYVTDDIRLTFGGYQGLATFAIGEHWWGPEAISASMTWRLGLNRTELQRRLFAALGPLMLHDTPGGREELREIVDPSLRDLVDDLLPVETAALSFDSTGTYFAGEAGGTAGVLNLVIRVRDGATVSWARRLGGEAARAVK